jgi:glycosyltransferase involved in cell wall biosynthesis
MITESKPKKCIFCGPVRNCGKYLDQVFRNIEKMGAIFDEYEIFIFYDHSTDNTLHKLQEYKKTHPNKLTFHINTNTYKLSPYRTHNIATARNMCLNHIKERNQHSDVPFEFMIMDNR